MRVFLLVCSCAAVALGFDPGARHSYTYQTAVLVREGCDGPDSAEKPVGHGIRAKVRLTAEWQNPADEEEKLIRMEVSDARLLLAGKGGSFEPRASKLDGLVPQATFVHWRGGRAKRLFEREDEPTDLRNLKRGIASLLQTHGTQGNETTGDASGECRVRQERSGARTRRAKADCRHPASEATRSRASGPLSGKILHSSTSDCEFVDGSSQLASRCAAADRLMVFSNVWRKPSLCVTSDSVLVLEGEEASPRPPISADDIESALRSAGASSAEKFVETDIYSIVRSEVKKSLKAVAAPVGSYQESLKASNLARLKSASAFLKLLPEFRAAPKEDVVGLLKNKKHRNIVPQLLDVAAACGSEECAGAAFEALDFSSGGRTDLAERYLVALAASPSTDAATLRRLLVVLEKPSVDEKVSAAALSSLGTLLKTYAEQHETADEKVAAECLSRLEGGLGRCRMDGCRTSHLRGLRNAARPASLSTLTEAAARGGAPALEAVLAIRRISEAAPLPPRVLDVLRAVFGQVGARQDRSTRAVAAEVLLRHRPDRRVARDILRRLSDQSDPEFSTFLAAKVARVVEEDPHAKRAVAEALADRDVGHYYSVSQKGASSLFRRRLASASGAAASYGSETEMLAGGLLRRSAFDVRVSGADGAAELLSVGVFAEGLSSLAGVDEAEEGGAAAEASAGMELSVLGSALRPYALFRGASEALSHVWSGTASEPTPALQGNLLLSEDSRVAVLGGGGWAVRLRAAAALSLDLTGAVQVSLWNRNSQSQVRAAGALLVRASAAVESELADARGEFSFGGESALLFDSALEFSEAPFRMCVRMEQPPFSVRRELLRTTSVAEFRARRKIVRKTSFAGRSFALNARNHEQCRAMLS